MKLYDWDVEIWSTVDISSHSSTSFSGVILINAVIRHARSISMASAHVFSYILYLLIRILTCYCSVCHYNKSVALVNWVQHNKSNLYWIYSFKMGLIRKTKKNKFRIYDWFVFFFISEWCKSRTRLQSLLTVSYFKFTNMKAMTSFCHLFVQSICELFYLLLLWNHWTKRINLAAIFLGMSLKMEMWNVK